MTTTAHSQLTPPLLLIAMPQVQDPFFHRSVVLIVQHDEQGSLGFIINRKTGSLVEELLQGMEIEWGGAKDLAVYFGGPVHPHLGTVLYDGSGVKPGPAGEGEMEIPGVPGVRYTRSMEDLKNVAGDPPAAFRLFLGYAGWGAGQLLQEILRNDWLTAPVDRNLVFSAEPDEVWVAAIRLVGADPDALLSWVPGSEEGPVS
jgi:putative transcriptional regulator